MNNKGFSLVEMAIALGLVAVLVSVVTAGSGMMVKSRVHRETAAVDSMRIAAQNYLSAKNLTYTGISVAALKTDGFLPANFDPVKSNSFGGDYLVAENAADNTKVDITLAAVPAAAGADLSNNFKSKAELLAYDASTKVWKATF
ncbi:MAG: prepilin-type N-terminal cleavage/methylation domain-containing protein [Candidatus Omnitrophica bacterium]|nr:prepilin-type N-terminal cleavage/methylation domain-containing protein [Candidatus Omnitrophota bacterium]